MLGGIGAPGALLGAIKMYIIISLPAHTARFPLQAREANMLHQHYEWLVVCAGVKPKTIEDLLCCTPSNLAILLPAAVTSSFNVTNDVSQGVADCTDYNISTVSFAHVRSIRYQGGSVL